MGDWMERIKLDEFRRQLTDELATAESQLADHGVTGDEVEIGLDEGFADSAQASTERSELVGVVRQLNSLVMSLSPLWPGSRRVPTASARTVGERSMPTGSTRCPR